MTAEDVIIIALRTIGAIAAGETPSTEELADGLTGLQNLVSNWNDTVKKSLAGSYNSVFYTFNAVTPPVALGSTITYPDSFLRALVYNLAVDLSFQWGHPPEQSVLAIAGASKNAVVTLPNPII